MAIKVFADGANLEGMLDMYENGNVQGFTTNPSLMKKGGVTDYRAFAKEVLAHITDVSVSFEVFADDVETMEVEAREIATWAENVYVKIPCVTTKGESTAELVHKLSADGIKVKTPGDLTFDMCREYVDEVVTVSEGEIASAILTVLEKQKLVAEGAGAVGIAAAMYHKVNTEGKTVCALLSGGNVDVTMLERILTRGLAKEGRTVSFSTVLPDQPHALASFLEVVSSMGANVLDVNHERRNTKAAIGSCVVNLSVETRDKAHIQELFGCLRRKGYVVEEQ